MKQLFLALLVSMQVGSITAGPIYKCSGPDGRLIYSDNPCGSKQEIFKKSEAQVEKRDTITIQSQLNRDRSCASLRQRADDLNSMTSSEQLRRSRYKKEVLEDELAENHLAQKKLSCN